MPAQRVELYLAIAFHHVLIQGPADQSIIEARVIEQHALLMDHHVARDTHVGVLDLITPQAVFLRLVVHQRSTINNVETRTGYRGQWREFGGSWIYPLGDAQISIGMVVGLDAADCTL